MQTAPKDEALFLWSFNQMEFNTFPANFIVNDLFSKKKDPKKMIVPGICCTVFKRSIHLPDYLLEVGNF